MSQEITNPGSARTVQNGAPQTWVPTPPGGHLDPKFSNEQGPSGWVQVLKIYYVSSQCLAESRKIWPNVHNPETASD